MSDVHHIYLIPGFFGFANLGRLRYFIHVHDFLAQRCAALGVRARIHVVKTHPTSSLPKRAARVAEMVARTLRSRRGVVDLIGHSTGGLDARLFAAPGVSLHVDLDVAHYAERVRTVITVATPHHGSPLASSLAALRGQRLLSLLSVSSAYVLRFGHLPISVLLQLATVFSRADVLGLQRTLLDELCERLLADFSLARRRAVQRLLAEVAQDQSLLTQLTPEAMDLFHAVVRDRPGVRYGAIVTRATPPGVRSTLATGFDPASQAMHAIYQALYRIAAQTPRSALAALGTDQARVLRRAYGALPKAQANDGIVPTRSQVWGDVIAAVQADHLDVIGHFNDPDSEPPHFDWLPTGSGFTREQFEAVWTAALDYILADRS
jgi:triacylglycerol lipase